ncbi:hypothetical protein C1Y63_06205 [Corynebacterium sp. 13CS0277]|nr:hypothetical protein C1Y63_06205 [Corynebacterium sp. 13CS0277]
MASKARPIILPETKGLSLHEIRDAAGFDLGLIVDTPFHQATLVLQAADGLLELHEKDTWLDLVCGADATQGVLAASIISTFCGGDEPDYSFITFRTSAAEVKKDLTGFLTSIAVKAPGLYAPEDYEYSWLPLDATRVTELANSYLVDADAVQLFPPAAMTGELHAEYIKHAGRYSVVFEIDSNDAAGAEAFREVHDVLCASEMPESLRLIRTARPTHSQYRQVHPDVAPSRTSSLLVVTGEELDIVDAIVAEILAVLSPRARLRLLRLTGRQHLGLLQASCLPVYGWQNQKTFTRTTKSGVVA